MAGAPTPSLGQYYLLDKIAQGGMAEIYKGLAYDLHGIQRTVVIKKILPHAAANPEFIDMLVAEAKIAVMLSHGNIAQIYDLGNAGDDYFIVMEYVEGRTVSQIQRESLAQGRYLPVTIACHVAAEVAAGLDYMHNRLDERGQPLHIVHRDVSPQNVMINTSGTVKIIDFGIAKARNKLETTEIGILKGKFAYMSPEHARGDVIDQRSDIFSLGVMLHELLVGRRLFKAKDHRETLKNVRRSEAGRPSELRRGIPPELDAIVLKALTKDRDQRYARASQMRSDLLKVLHHSFPEFRIAHIPEFVSDLFASELRAPGEESDAKTPLLIIDKTQSALGTVREEHTQVRSPEDAEDFLLPFLDERAEYGDAAEDFDDEASVTQVRAVWLDRCRTYLEQLWERGQQQIGWRGVIVLASVVALLAGALVWNNPRVQAWWNQSDDSIVELESETVIEVAPSAAIIQITTQPAGARIFLNDVDTGQVSPAAVRIADPGQHTIGLHLANYQYVSKSLEISAEKERKISVSLQFDYATLIIESTPPGADVYLDGQRVGVTPWRQEQAQPGRVADVELRKAGYYTVQRSVPLRAGQEAAVQVALPRE